MCDQEVNIMPNMKNAEKRILVNAKKEQTNNNYEASMKTAIKNVEKAVNANDKGKATENLKTAIKRIDKAVSSGLIHKNKAAREKSKLMKKKNEME